MVNPPKQSSTYNHETYYLLLLASFLLSTLTQANSPFDGKSLQDWKTKPRGKNTNQWKVGIAAVNPERPNELVVKEGSGEMVNTPSKATGKSLDIYSTFTHGDARIELELMVPKGSNSGIYLHGEYEVQVLDSYGRNWAWATWAPYMVLSHLQQTPAKAWRVAEVHNSFSSAEVQGWQKSGKCSY